MSARVNACACACWHVALHIHVATRMRHVVTSFVAPLVPPYFSTLSHKWHNFRGKKITEHKMWVLIFSTVLKNISHSKEIQRGIAINVKCLHVKYLLFLSDFNKTWNFLYKFSKKAHVSSFIKIRLLRAELFHTDGRTDGHYEANSRFSQLCERA